MIFAWPKSQRSRSAENQSQI